MCADCGLPQYQYQDLRTDPDCFSIRLVRLHPARSLEADIVIELIPNDVDDPVYDALSWCWGRSARLIPIRARCDDGDRCFRIPANLESALRQLRLVDNFRTLWIDALSINQANPKEKNRQVPMMSDIYSRATQVCIWLGDGDVVSARAIEFINNYVLDLHNFDLICRDEKFAGCWRDMVQLMERPWFSRRWVIQEIALADRNRALVMCGSDSISWAKFSEAVSLFEKAQTGALDLSKLNFTQRDNISYSTRYAPALGAIRLVKASDELFLASSYDEKKSRLQSLEYLVSTFTMYNTSEPRDVIYSLLSISEDAFRFDSPQDTKVHTTPFDHLPLVRKAIEAWMEDHLVRRAFPVDYRAPVIEVYKQFISFSISKAPPARALDIICRPWAPVIRNVELPSWITTLAKDTYKVVDQHTTGQRQIRRNPDSLVGSPKGATYNASMGVGPPKAQQIFRYWKTADRSMFLSGFVLDQISDLESPSQLGNIPPEWVNLGRWNPTHEDPPDDFWRTLVADKGPDGREPLLFYPRACREVFQHAVDDTLDVTMLINHGSSIIADYLKRVQAVVWNRRLMRTQRESWLGLAPKTATKDDIICILYGCSVPVILRRVQKTVDEITSEREDYETRKANAFLYIAKKIAVWGRKRRAARGEPFAERLGEDGEDVTDASTQVTGIDQSGNPDSAESVFAETQAGSGSGRTNQKKRPHDSTDNSGHGRYRERDGFDPQALTRETTLRYDSYYMLIGECYVHGMMNGEARIFRSRFNAGKAMSGRILTETFELR